MDWKNHRIHRRLSLRADVVENIYAAISDIDAVKNSWHITGNLLPQMIQRLTRSVIITSTGASNRIEGNKLTDSEIEHMYKNMHVQKFKSRDEQEVLGYIEYLELVFENYNHIQITESTILEMHKKMLVHSERDESHRGIYKIGSNRVEARDGDGNIVGVIFDPTPPYLVKKEIQELVEWYNWSIGQREKHPLIIIANFIFEYLAIHPFQDGNGRTSRLLTNLMLMKQGYEFTRFVSHESIIESKKVDYYLALNKTQNTWKKNEEDISPWILFFLDVLRSQASRALKLTDEDNLEYRLSEKQLEFWNWASSAHGEFSRKSAVTALGFPERTVESIIKKLLDMNRIEKLGQGKATRYRMLK